MPDASRLHDLTGRVALVIRGGRGLGRAREPAIAPAGAEVIIAACRPVHGGAA